MAVSATGLSHVAGGPENIAYLTLFFDSDLIAHIHVNWLAPVKIRRTLIGGSRKMIVYDDLEPSEKIKVYDKGITVNQKVSPDKLYELLVGYRTGDMWAPQLDVTEALRVEAEHFLECIEKSSAPSPTARPDSAWCACSRPRRSRCGCGGSRWSCRRCAAERRPRPSSSTQGDSIPWLPHRSR